jgi:hypothetical protein
MTGSLVAEGIGKPFSPGTGRVMKGWIEVTHPKADWLALAKEACRLAAPGASAKESKRRWATVAARTNEDVPASTPLTSARD